MLQRWLGLEGALDSPFSVSNGLVLLADPWVQLAGLLLVSIVAMSDFYRRFDRSIKSAPRLDVLSAEAATMPTVTVIIPAYNESINIKDCLRAVLASELPDTTVLQVIVADDDSTDDTL